MRRILALTFVLAGCATGGGPSPVGDDIDASEPPDGSTNPPPDGSTIAPDAPPDPPPDAQPDPPPDAAGNEVTAQEALCNDGFDNDGDGQVDCADTTCAWACTALAACTAPSHLRAYSMAPMPQGIPDVSSVSASVAVAQSGTIVTTAIRFNATHTYDNDVDLTVTSPAGTTIDLTSDNGGANDNFVDTVFIDSAPTSITAGAAPFTGSFQPEAPLSGLNGQSISGTWSSLLVDDLGGDTGTWTELSVGLCVTP